jgi:hypothetical protein
MIQIVHAPSGTNFQQGDAIPNGSIIRLQHVRTRKWLHSHLHQSPISGNLEVGGFLYCWLCDVSCQHNLSVSSVTDSRHSQWIPILLFSKSPLPFEISQGSGWLLLAWAKGKTSLVLSSLPDGLFLEATSPWDLHNCFGQFASLWVWINSIWSLYVCFS